MTIEFNWDGHVGSQTPLEFADACDDIESGVRDYVDAVRAGDVFCEPINLDDNAADVMLEIIRIAMDDGQA